MKSLRRKQTLAFSGVLIFFMLACNATFSVGFPTATLSPPTKTPTATPPSLQLKLISVPYNENSINPPSTITAQMPQLTGSDDPRVRAFNQAINNVLHNEIDNFKLGLAGLPTPPSTATSTFDAKYNVVYQSNDVWSLIFNISVYVDGAAHPADLVRTLNYDFAHSDFLSLGDLFLADSNYLEFISKYCSEQLSTMDISFDETSVGAEPTAQNYRNWNITVDGLMLTFERGQVAAYAVPTQSITIPYSELKSMVNPQGPLAMFIR